MIFSGKRVKTEGKPAAGNDLAKPAGVAGGANGLVPALLVTGRPGLGLPVAIASSTPAASLGKLAGATLPSSGTAHSAPLLRSRCSDGLTPADPTRARSPSSSYWW